jgi:galactose-1-phosphate uridylyltransferase
MSQMRKDIFTDRWVIVEEGEGLQPTDFHFKKFARDTGFCPFCESNEAATPPEVFAIRNRGLLLTGRDGRYGWCLIPGRGCA